MLHLYLVNSRRRQKKEPSFLDRKERICLDRKERICLDRKERICLDRKERMVLNLSVLGARNEPSV